MSEVKKEQQDGTAGAEIAVREKVPVAAGSGGFEIASLEQAYRFGQYVAKSRFYPVLDQAEKVVVALQLAHDNCVPFSTIASNIAFINGKACMYGDGLIGIAHASRQMEDFAETFDEKTQTAYCTIKRKGLPTPVVGRFSKADAEAAKLIGKDTYKNYLRRMLTMRARSWALRDAGLVQGIIAREEAEDIPPERSVPAFPVSESGKTKTERVADQIAGVAEEPPPAETKEPEPEKKPEPPKAAEEKRPAPPRAKASQKFTVCPSCEGRLFYSAENHEYTCSNCGLIYNEDGEVIAADNSNFPDDTGHEEQVQEAPPAEAQPAEAPPVCKNCKGELKQVKNRPGSFICSKCMLFSDGEGGAA